MKFDIFKPLAIHEIGRQPIQEDAIFPELGKGTIHDRLFLVCDGLGGEGLGDVASTTVAATISDYIFQNTCTDEPLDEEILKMAFIEAYKGLDNRFDTPAAVSMAMVYFHRHGCLAAHIGNSRVYHVRPKNHTLMYRSRDNFKTMVPDTDNPAEPTKAYITDVRHGDYFVLLTRGASANLQDSQVVDIVCGKDSDEEKLAELRQHIGDSKDNFSLYLIHVSGVMDEAIDDNLPDNERLLMAACHGGQAAETPQQHKMDEVKEKRMPTTHEKHDAQDDGEKGKRKKQRSFPVVWLTALALITAAGLLLYCGQGKTKHQNEQQLPKEQPKPKPEKDTMNVMHGSKSNPIELDEKAKKEEEAKKKEEEAKKKKEEEKRKEDEEQRKMDENTGDVPPPAPMGENPPPPRDIPDPAGPPPPPPGKPHEATGGTPPPPPPPANNSGLRPVIPED